MNTPFDDSVKRVLEPFEWDHDRLRAELMATLPAEAPGAPCLDASPRRRPWIGLSPMTRRILRIGIPAAAAAAVLLVVGLWPETGRKGSPGGSGRVYALSDIPELLHDAKVLHLHDWFYIPNPSQGPPGVQRRKMGSDTWLDTANGRWRRWFTDLGLTDGSPPTEEQKKKKYPWLQWVGDGEYMMELAYRAPVFRDDPSIKKTAEFTRLTPFMRNLRVRWLYPRVTAFAEEFRDAKVLSRFVKVGQETIDGVAFEIWENEQDVGRWDKATQNMVYDGLQRSKSRVWLSPASGAVGRIEHWFKGPTTNGIWVDDGGIDLVERDVVPPPGIFDTTPPPEYTLKNTKETAPVASISDECSEGGVGDLEVLYHIGFNFSDGTVLLGWSSRDPKSTESQASLFQDLSPGGPLPKLPIEIQAFVPENPDCHLTYTGRHLAWTQKGGRFYEWSLFVPNRDLTSPQDRCADMFELRHTINSTSPTATGAATKKKLHYTCDWTSPSASINDPAEFQVWALGAMAELSDSGAAPEGITYEYVIQLSRQIRESLGKP